MGSITGSICGTFLVGSGVRAGQPINADFGKARLKLNGEAFVNNLYNDLEQLFFLKARLLLRPKGVVTSSTLIFPTAKSRMILRGKAFVLLEPDVVKPGRGRLTLKGKAVALKTDSIMGAGKPKLILSGKEIRAGVAGLVANTPRSVNLVPTVETDPLSLDPIEQTVADLVPTTEKYL